MIIFVKIMSEAQYLLKYVLHGNSVPLNSISHETKIELVYRLADYIIENGEKYKDIPIGIDMYLRCLNIDSCTSKMLDKVMYELSMFIQNSSQIHTETKPKQHETLNSKKPPGGNTSWGSGSGFGFGRLKK